MNKEHFFRLEDACVCCGAPICEGRQICKECEKMLKQDDIQLLEKKDYIANPKPNGYRSLHLIVTVPIFLANEKRIMKVEIQLRTIAMDSWAALEHQIRYKKEVEFTDEMADELFHCAQLSAELDATMDKLRNMAMIKNQKIK